jgi:hypothetical protein
MSTFADLQRQAFATASDKGWHEIPLRGRHDEVNYDRLLARHALFHTELTEARVCLVANDLALWLDKNNGNKPEGFVAEMADVAIRIADTTGALCLSLDETLAICNNSASTVTLWTDHASNIDCIDLIRRGLGHGNPSRAVAREWLDKTREYIDYATEAARGNDWRSYAGHIVATLRHTVAICKGLSLNIDEAIEAKLVYNRTRPHRHGGKTA